MAKISFIQQTKDILTRNECAALKGIGILMIVLHNMAHFMGISQYDCNEYAFHPDGAQYLWNYLFNPNGDFVFVYLTLLGYAGIHIFLFCSAYGLVRKYEQSAAAPVSAWKFISGHYVKLFRLSIIGLILAIGSVNLLYDKEVYPMIDWIPQALMLNNLHYPPYEHVWPGPYWFLGLMVQLYIVYRLVLYVPKDGAKWRRWVWPLVFLAATLGPQMYVGPETRDMIYMRYNFPVASISFAMGLLVARYGGIPKLKRWAWGVVFVASVALYLSMQYSKEMWLLSPFVLIVCLISLVKACGENWMKPIAWVGGISSFLFIMHPVVRLYICRTLSWGVEPHVTLAAYLAISLAAAVLYKKLLAIIPWPKLWPLNWFKKH